MQSADAAATLGADIIARLDRLASWSDAENGLTCAYLTPAHRAAAAQLLDWMREAWLEARIDAVGNVVGRYRSDAPGAKTLIVGSHYDTVRNGGRYDGRLGIVLPIAAIRRLAASGRKLPFHLEIIGFADEEGVRFGSTFLGSSAVAGRFDATNLDRRDEQGITMRAAMRDADLDPTAIPALARDRAQLAGYLEIHIEQGPVLLQAGLPVGVVTAINGARRFLVAVTGIAGHAGTVPMAQRHDAAAAAAELVLAVERRCSDEAGLVGTVGRLAVADGAVNVIPGRCDLSLDIRAASDAQRDDACANILAEAEAIAGRRGVAIKADEIMRAPAAACSKRLQRILAGCVERAGVKPLALTSGAGHDALIFAGVTEIGMLFVRCGAGGVSHSPLETMTEADAEIAARVFLDALDTLAGEA